MWYTEYSSNHLQRFLNGPPFTKRHLKALSQIDIWHKRLLRQAQLKKQLANFGYATSFKGSVLSYRTIPVTLVLKDPQYPDQDLGSLELAVTLTPKESPIEERRDSTVHKQIRMSRVYICYLKL